jgi:hypothetical protein
MCVTPCISTDEKASALACKLSGEPVWVAGGLINLCSGAQITMSLSGFVLDHGGEIQAELG